MTTYKDHEAVGRVSAAGTAALLAALATGADLTEAVAGTVAAETAVEAVQALHGRSRRRSDLQQAAVLHACATASGVSDAVLAAAFGANAKLLDASRRILDAAAETVWIDKLAVLGALLTDAAATGSEAHDARVHVEFAAVADLERPHVRLLGTIARQRQPEPPGEFTGWPYHRLIDELGYEEGIIDSLLATLTRHGLSYDAATGTMAGLEGDSVWVASTLGRRMLNLFRQAAETIAAGQDPAG